MSATPMANSIARKANIFNEDDRRSEIIDKTTVENPTTAARIAKFALPDSQMTTGIRLLRSACTRDPAMTNSDSETRERIRHSQRSDRPSPRGTPPAFFAVAATSIARSNSGESLASTVNRLIDFFTPVDRANQASRVGT